MVKRKDFSETLKQLTDCLERMCSGNRFHSDGAATANERAPNFVAVLGMTRSSRSNCRGSYRPETAHVWWAADFRPNCRNYRCLFPLHSAIERVQRPQLTIADQINASTTRYRRRQQHIIYIEIETNAIIRDRSAAATGLLS